MRFVVSLGPPVNKKEISMNEVKLILVKDESGSECSKMYRYVFGKPGSQISGGIYFKKGVPVPDQVVLAFRKESEDVSER
jgi:hypothetical protein